ncbi:MAG: class I tRNA ligase family protein, partial [Sphingomonadaceae bacterium]|nr:class I tRNA ligase family protein [Sphingomonadaceae bacterium]
LEPPKSVFGHGFVLHRGEKMSKSTGNVVDPIALAERYGVDALRYFLLREVSFGQDGSWSEEAIVTRCNAELSNSFGNLAQRVLSMIAKNLNGELPHDIGDEAEDQKLRQAVSLATHDTLRWEFEQLSFSAGLEAWLSAVFACNQYVDAQAPWALRKTDPDRMRQVLANLFYCIRALAIAVQPVIPQTAANLLTQMGIDDHQRTFSALGEEDWYADRVAFGPKIETPEGAFPRLELSGVA